MAAIFGEGKIFLKIAKSTLILSDTLWVENFRQNRSILHGSGDRSKFVFCDFGQKFLKFKMATIFGRGKFFENCSVTLWVKNFDEIALSHTVKEIEANLWPHFWQSS